MSYTSSYFNPLGDESYVRMRMNNIIQKRIASGGMEPSYPPDPNNDESMLSSEIRDIVRKKIALGGELEANTYNDRIYQVLQRKVALGEGCLNCGMHHSDCYCKGSGFEPGYVKIVPPNQFYSNLLREYSDRAYGNGVSGGRAVSNWIKCGRTIRRHNPNKKFTLRDISRRYCKKNKKCYRSNAYKKRACKKYGSKTMKKKSQAKSKQRMPMKKLVPFAALPKKEQAYLRLIEEELGAVPKEFYSLGQRRRTQAKREKKSSIYKFRKQRMIKKKKRPMKKSAILLRVEKILKRTKKGYKKGFEPGFKLKLSKGEYALLKSFDKRKKKRRHRKGSSIERQIKRLMKEANKYILIVEEYEEAEDDNDEERMEELEDDYSEAEFQLDNIKFDLEKLYKKYKVMPGHNQKLVKKIYNEYLTANEGETI